MLLVATSFRYSRNDVRYGTIQRHSLTVVPIILSSLMIPKIFRRLLFVGDSIIFFDDSSFVGDLFPFFRDPLLIESF